MQFTAKKVNSDFILKVDGCEFGRLVDCESIHIFQSSDDMLTEIVNSKMEGDFSLKEMLATAKAGYLAYVTYCQAEQNAELASERAYYNHVEHDAEAYDEMVRQDMMGLT